MSTINDKIQEYLAQEKPEYFEGVALYEDHPDARKNLIVNFRQMWNKSIMHSKLIYELERLIKCQVYSNKSAVHEHRPANIPYKLIEKTNDKAPEKFEYKTNLADLPQELKDLVIEKGQLYNALEVNKKKMASLGEANNEKTIAKRKVIYQEMVRQSDKIKEIHRVVMAYDETKAFDENEIKAIKNTQAGGTSEINKPLVLDESTILEKLQEEFEYQEMSYYKRKDLLKKLRSAVPKQEQRAKDTEKPDIRQKNEEKALLGREMIKVLENYFSETQKPEK